VYLEGDDNSGLESWHSNANLSMKAMDTEWGRGQEYLLAIFTHGKESKYF
jgi:hypothetical protein